MSLLPRMRYLFPPLLRHQLRALSTKTESSTARSSAQRHVHLDKVLNDVEAYLAVASNRSHASSTKKDLARAMTGVDAYIAAVAQETPRAGPPTDVPPNKSSPGCVPSHIEFGTEDFWTYANGKTVIVEISALCRHIDGRPVHENDLARLVDQLARFWDSCPTRNCELVMLLPSLARNIAQPKGVKRVFYRRPERPTAKRPSALTEALNYLQIKEGLSPENILVAADSFFRIFRFLPPAWKDDRILGLEPHRVRDKIEHYFFAENMLNGKMSNYKILKNSLRGKQIVVHGASLLSVAGAGNADWLHWSKALCHRRLMARLSVLAHNSDPTIHIFYDVNQAEAPYEVPARVTMVHGGVDECVRDLTDPTWARGRVMESNILTFASPGDSRHQNLPPEILWDIMSQPYLGNWPHRYLKVKQPTRNDAHKVEDDKQEDVTTSDSPASWWKYSLSYIKTLVGGGEAQTSTIDSHKHVNTISQHPKSRD